MRFGAAFVCAALLACIGPTAALSQTARKPPVFTPDFSNVDVRILVHAFAAVAAKKRVVIDPSVKATVSLMGDKLTYEEFQDAVAGVLKANGLSMEEKDGVLLVAHTRAEPLAAPWF